VFGVAWDSGVIGPIAIATVSADETAAHVARNFAVNIFGSPA
jgi:hypothetical protein